MSVCKSTPMVDEDQKRLVALRRRTAAFLFGRQDVRSKWVNPVDTYGVCFGLVLDPMVRRRVIGMFDRAAARVESGWFDDRRGFIYAFHDIGDPSTVIKIGRTERDPRERVREWNRELSASEDRAKNLTLLFAYPTRSVVFAEGIVHETLRCERIANRLNPSTAGELDEFFEIANFMALKVFLRNVTKYIDRFVANKRFATQ